MIKFYDYSEKSFAICGSKEEMEQYNSELKKFARFNKFLSVGAGWVVKKDKESEIKCLFGDVEFIAVSGGQSNNKDTSDKNKNYIDEAIESIKKTCSSFDKSDEEWFRKYKSFFCKLPCGDYIPFDKHDIEKNFCFGYGYSASCDEAQELADKAKKDPEYFLSENLNKYDKEIADCIDDEMLLYLYKDIKRLQESPVWSYMFYDNKLVAEQNLSYSVYRLATDEERNIIETSLKLERAKFEKRLQSYLKKYGLSKLHVWTYDQMI